MKAFFRQNRKLHLWLLCDLVLLAAFFLLRRSRGIMNALTHGFTNPLRRAVGRVCERFPFSVAELLIVLLVLFVLFLLGQGIYRLCRRAHKGQTLYRLALTLVLIVTTIYALFCLLWGANYYADSYFSAGPVSLDDLTRVTAYFAAQVNETAGTVERDEDGVFAVDRDDILSYAPKVYDNLYEEFPILRAEDCIPKKIYFSRIMSMLDFTGFYFPFTGESNVNMDFPAANLPVTVAHELSHRRGIASEQECNFLGILASVRSDDAVYQYSGWLVGYIHLSNALYSADHERWKEIRATLDERALADMRASSEYWAQFEGPIDTISNKVYDSFLKSYGTIGLQSYGACVDLLVDYFK